MPTFHPQCRSLIVPADLERVTDVRHFVDELAEQAGFDHARRFDIKLVTAEATANAMEHAETAGEVRIELELYADRLEVRVLGLGEFRLPGSECERQHRGLGLPLMATLSDHLALYSQPDGGTLVALTFYLPGYEARAQPSLPLPPGLIDVLTESDLLDQVLESLPHAFVVYDEEWRHAYVNQAGEELAGLPREELLGRVLWEVFPQVAGISAGREYVEAAASGQMREWTDFLPDLGRWVRRRAIPFSGGLAVIAEDVTEARRAEADGEGLVVRLREERDRLQTVLKSMNDGLVIADSQGTVLEMNDVAVRLIDLGDAHQVRRSLSDWRDVELRTLDGELIPIEDRPLSRALRGETFTGYEVEVHNLVTGRTWVASYSGAPVLDDEGRPVLAVLTLRDMTGEKRVEAELRESEARFRLALANTSITVATLDADLRYTWVFNTRHGFRPEMVLGKRADELIDPEEAREVIALQREALASGRSVEREVRGRTDSREWVYDAAAEPLRDRRGEVIGLRYVAVDVTERQLADEAAERSSARFELLIATASDLLACDQPQDVVETLCRRVLDFLDCQAFFNYLAVPSQHRLHLNACAGIPDGLAEGIEWLEYGQAVCGCVAQGRERMIAQHILESDDQLTDLVRSFGIRAYACHPLMAVGRLLGTLSFGTTTRDEFRDDELDLMRAVADQVAVAMERGLSKRELAEREERFRVTFDQAAVGMAHVGLDGRFLRVNEKFAAIVGYSEDELVKLSFRDITHPGDRRRDLAYANKLRHGEIPSYSLEKRYVRKDGSAVWVNLAGSLVGDGKSKDSYFVAVVEDIRARKQAEIERDNLLTAVHETSKDLAAANRELHRQNESLAARQEELRLQTQIAEDARVVAEERSRLARALNDLNQAITSSLSLEEVMTHVVRAAADALPAEAAVIESPAAGGWSVAYAYGLSEDLMGGPLVSECFPIATLVAGQTEPLIVEDAGKERRLRSSTLLRAGLQSFIAVPLRVRDQVFGVLILLNRAPVDEFRAAQVDFVRKLGSSVSLALENSRLLGWLQEEVAGLAVLRDVAAAAAGSLELERIAEQVLAAVKDHLGARAGSAFVLDESARMLRHLTSFGFHDGFAQLTADLPYDEESHVGSVLKSGVPWLTHASAEEPPTGGQPTAIATEQDRWIVLPVRVARRRVGALLLVFAGRRPFTDGELALFASIAEQLGVASENARLYHAQRVIADALQDDVLAVPARVPGIQVAHVYRSATEAARVGGDFYDVFSPEEGKAAFLIGDVCGFGVRAATQASLVRDTLRAYLFGGFSLERVMSLANKVLGRQTGFNGFTTVFLGLLDIQSGGVSFCGAGHPPAVLRRVDGTTVSLSTGSLPLGAFPDSVYRIGTEVLAPGDLLLLYTDGVLEARRDGELFGERRVDDVVRGSADGVKRLTRDLLRRVTEFSGGNLRDDLALLALTRKTRKTTAGSSSGISS